MDRGQECGFSLIEVLMVLAVSAVLIACTAPGFSAIVADFGADVDAAKIRSMFRKAQGLAIGDHVDRRVVFDVAASTYRLESAGRTLSSEALSSGVTIAPSPLTTFAAKRGKIKVIFEASGWGTAGTLVLRSSRGRLRKVVVQVGTGLVVAG